MTDGQSIRSVIPSDSHLDSGDEDEQYSPLEGQHDSHDAPPGGVEMLRGTGGEARNLDGLDADEPALNVEEIIRRFVDETKNRYRSDSPTAGDYSVAFRRFAKTVRLGDYTKRQLTPKRAHAILMDYMSTMKPGSKRWILTALRSVWVNGGLGPWPVDIVRDFGRSLPKPQRREAPTDAEVKPFAEALAKEPNTYVRLFVRMILTYGLRPEDQLGALRWSNVRYDASENACAFVARGVDEGFKTGSPFIAHVPAALAEDLRVWRSLSPNAAPEAPVLPRMGKHGKIADPMRRHSTNSAECIWNAYRERHGIRSTLTMAHMRHFVKRHGRKALDPAVLAYWSGHDAKSEGGGMSLHYGTNLPVEEVLEEQAREWPEGPLGDILPVQVREVPGISPEVAKIVAEFMSGKVDGLQVAMKLGELRQKIGVVSDIMRT